MKICAFFSIILLFSLAACTEKNCVLATNSVCNETVPSNEMCAAAFERWFFNSSTNKCEKKGYSGCSQKGFATEQECEACKCR